MDLDALQKRLMGTFLAELEERCDAIEQGMLDLERAAPGDDMTATFHDLVREAHSLKGAGGALGLGVVQRACHQLEDLLVGLERGSREPTPALYDLLLRSVDALREAATRLRAEEPLEGGALDRLTETLEAVAGGAEPSAAAGTAPDEGPREASAARPPPRAAPQAPPETMLRVDADHVDRLVDASGQMLVALRAMERLATDLESARTSARRREARPGGARRRPGSVRSGAAPDPEDPDPDLAGIARRLDRLGEAWTGERRVIWRTAAALDQAARNLRVAPFEQATRGLDRLLRDQCRATGKRATLALEGGDVELDRQVVDALRDALRHMLRNAIDHGIEPPEERVRAGKPAEGRLAVQAALAGDRIRVTVADDGRGLDTEALRTRAERAGVAAVSDAEQVGKLVFAPGLSTAGRVTWTSGRGAGLDAVRAAIEGIHGSVDVSWRAGAGTTFVLDVPLRVGVLRGLLVRAGGERLILPASSVHRALRLAAADIALVDGQPMLAVDGAQVPVADLASLLGFEADEDASRARHPAVMVASGGARVVLLVGALLEEREVVVRELDRRAGRSALVGGATILPDGNVGLVLQAGEVVRRALGSGAGVPARGGLTEARTRPRRRVLVVDDALTTRTLLSGILAEAGFEVATASDGEEALAALQRGGVDLLLADVEMPRLDGIELTRRVRASRRHRDLPVLLVTGRETDADRVLGLEAGANRYLGKSVFDQEALVAAVRSLLGEAEP